MSKSRKSRGTSQPPRDAACILILEDEAALRERVEQRLEKDGHRVRTAGTVAQALRASDGTTFDVLLATHRGKECDGVGLARQIRERQPDTEVVLVAGPEDRDAAVSALKDGAFDTIAKPYGLDEMSATVRRALERRRLVHENRLLQEGLLGELGAVEAFDADPWGTEDLDDDPTVGRMAGSAAHMINSPLAAILGFSELILARPDLDPDVRRFTRLIHEEGKKIRDVTRRLRDLARQEETSAMIEAYVPETRS